MEPTFTIVLPTVNRPCLKTCLESIRRQDLRPGDEVLIVSDGVYDGCREVWESYNLPGRFMEHAAGPSGDWGHTIRNLYMKECRTTHIMHMDDDDIYAAKGLATVREKVSTFPDSLHLFSLGDGTLARRCLWTHQKLGSYTLGNVDTKIVVHKADGNWATWTSGHDGDSQFIRFTAEMYEDIKWWEEVIAIMRPQPFDQCGY